MIGDNDTGYVCTFHGFCVQVLREDIHVINYPENFIILDTEDTEAILKTVYENAGIQSKNYTFDMARRDIAKAKSEGEAELHRKEPEGRGFSILPAPYICFLQEMQEPVRQQWQG